MQGENFSFGGSFEWPDYIPDDIPPIPADITLVRADDNLVRIFFSNLPKEDFEAYLQLLKQNGFNLEYIVYEQPGIQVGNAEELVREGKYDAVRITKGKYSMNIEYWNNEGTYDLDPKGFPEGTVIKNRLQWPEELNGILDQPDNSTVIGIMSASGGALDIACRSDNPDLLNDYIAKLVSDGFEKGYEYIDQNGEFVNVTYIKGTVTAVLSICGPDSINIRANPHAALPSTGTENLPAAGAGWPDCMPIDLPEFKGGNITYTRTDEYTRIYIIPTDPNALDAYRQLLLDSGFTKQDTKGDVYSGRFCTVTIEGNENAPAFSLTIN